uniref:AAA+ ATPase domain-containing protein n=1 Tax=Fagus sylvatica TaxID=28930 RepID=A0A2N9H0Y0_FAGSY
MEIVISIVAKIGEYLVEPIGQQFGYLIHLNSNIQNLKDQFQNLDKKRHDVQSLGDAERRNGQEILRAVDSWVKTVDEIRQALQTFIDETLEIDAETRNDQVTAPEVEQWVGNISQGLQKFIDEDKMCLDLKSRYSLSKERLRRMTLEIDGLLKEAEPFVTEMAYSPPPLGMVSTEVFKHFESRISIMKEVLEALRDDNINMIAICGMGGIGKTTMAKEVAKRAKEAKLFDEDVMAVVSQNQDVKHIQGQIADMLHLQLKTESLQERANQLFERLMDSESVDIKKKKDSKSVLVILDDVWEALNLTDVGIPCGGQNKRCKILLTSRSEEACNQMRSQKIVPIKVLSEEEAWNLFREMAGDCVDTHGLHQIAKEVAKECGGLPVAIVTVARALENKSKNEWIAALEQLKKSIPKNIPGLHSKVYSSIEFSYSYLKSDEAKSCFLLCCLFPEDFDIPIEYLVRYGVGRRLFAKIDNVAEARSRVHAMVNDLKRSFLLLDSKQEECVKMHDVVRDVAISIAEEHGFLVGCDAKIEEWPEYVAISLVSQRMENYPDGLKCPKLELLHLSRGIGTPKMLLANLFKVMKELKVLSIQHVFILSLPQSIQVSSEPSDTAIWSIIFSGGHHFLEHPGSRTPCYMFKNTLEVEEGDASDIAGSPMIRQLLQKSEILRLQQIKDLEYVIDTASNQNPPVACPVLEELELSDLSNLKEIYHGQFLERSFSGAQLASFGNLRCLKLLSCKHLKNVFSLSIARGLVQLHELDIVQCDDIEEIFSNEREDEKAVDMIKFPKLTYISLLRLPRLIGFCKPTDLVELVQPSHPKSTQPSPKQEVGRITTDELTKDKMTDIQHTGSFSESRPISPKFFSSKTILWPPNLEQLYIWGVDLLEVVFDLEGLKVDDGRQTITTLAQLKTFRAMPSSVLPHRRNYGPMVESDRGSSS